MKIHIDYKSMRRKLTTETFIIESKLIHGEKYDYSKVNYKTCKDKVIIKCILHNFEFEQKSLGHLQGKGLSTVELKIRKTDF